MTHSSMTPLRRFAIRLVLLLLALAPPLAQARVPAPAELERLVAPIALYPDALLAQVLVAATRPAELARAAHWSAAHPGREGEPAVRAVAPYGWDPAVQSLVAFPPLLARLAAQPDWLHALGDAFADHEPHVMDAVQSLRRRAQAAGTLVDDDRLRVRIVYGQIVLQPLDLHTVYVPWYDPWIAYGLWPWQAHPPVVWARWPGVHAARHGVSFWWGPGTRISVNLFADPLDWRHRRLPAVHRHAPSPRHAAPARRFAAPEGGRHAAPDARRPAAPAARRERAEAHSVPRRAPRPEVAPVQRRERVEARGVPRSEARAEVRTDPSRARAAAARPRLNAAPAARSETRLR